MSSALGIIEAGEFGSKFVAICVGGLLNDVVVLAGLVG